MDAREPRRSVARSVYGTGMDVLRISHRSRYTAGISATWRVATRGGANPGRGLKVFLHGDPRLGREQYRLDGQDGRSHDGGRSRTDGALKPFGMFVR